jgi:CHRD domain
MAAKGKAGNVLIPLCGTTPVCKSGLTGSATLNASDISWLKKHLLYVNVHTVKNLNGEIRGRLAVGEPQKPLTNM